MEKLRIMQLNEGNNFYLFNKIIVSNRKILGVLPIHEDKIQEYVLLVSYFPFTDTKEKVYLSLDNKRDRIGMLNRHILSVARKLDISQIIIKRAKESSINYNRYKNYGKDYENLWWSDQVIKYRENIIYTYDLLLKMIFEENIKRRDVKYVRKKKLEELMKNG